jgi:outer membrane receptor for ferrienterochelin and colicin
MLKSIAGFRYQANSKICRIEDILFWGETLMSRYNQLFLCLFVLIAPFFLMAAIASDLTSLGLEELMQIPVYGTSKFEQKASNAPSSITIVTADDIQKYGYRAV